MTELYLSGFLDFTTESQRTLRELQGKNEIFQKAYKLLTTQADVPVNNLTFTFIANSYYLNFIVDEIAREKDFIIKAINR